MMSRPFYGEFAWAYDLVIRQPSRERCDFIQEMFTQSGVGAGAGILDAGCGTGSYALELARRGYVVSGFDISEDLLAVAIGKARQESVQVAFSQGDITEIKSAKEFDGILCRGVLNDFTAIDSRRKVFVSFANNLRRGGVLILDVRDWEATRRRKEVEPVFSQRFSTERGDFLFRSETVLEPQKQKMLIEEVHQKLDPGGEKTVARHKFEMCCWTKDELTGCLNDAGFIATAYYGGYAHSSVFGSSDRIVAVAILDSAQ